MAVALRPLAPSDSIDALTTLLHRAYAPLGAMGLNYTAADQSVDTTARRFAGGHGLVAELDGVVDGTVVVNGPLDADETPDARACAWYLRRDVAHLHQLGVEPALQGQGIGHALIAACERWATEQGLRAIALDTAMPASLPWHPRLSERLGLFRYIESAGSHEAWFTQPAALARAIIEAGRD